MNIPLSYSKYSAFLSCPIKYLHQYVIKTQVDEDITYPLVLGQLTHLFIQLYNDEIYTKKQLRDIVNHLDVLYDLVTLQYPSLYNNVCEIKKMDIKNNVDKLITFITDNPIVFPHALKLFNIYHEKIFPKVNQSTKFITESTFHNVMKLNDDYSVCLYGSIDLIFFNVEQSILKYIYISDFKTGKALYSHYYDQLFFYFYNILNYDTKNSSEIKNNTDNLEALTVIKEHLQDFSKVHLLLFNLREAVNEKKIVADVKDDYTKFITSLKNNIKTDLYNIHKDKDFITPKDIYEQYNESHKYVMIEECDSKNVSTSCGYCKFKELCDYRIKKK